MGAPPPATTLILSPPPPLPPLFHLRPLSSACSAVPPLSLKLKPLFSALSPLRRRVVARADEGDGESGGADDYEMDEDEMEEVDNKKDFDIEYEPLSATDDIEMVKSKSFVSTGGSDSDTVVDYRIDEAEFHKISLFHCDFFIRKPPDPDNDVYDFREMYVTPPDMDVYSIPRVLAPMPQKYIRCAKSDYGCYNVTEPPIDAPRDPLYKSEREILKVCLRIGFFSNSFGLAQCEIWQYENRSLCRYGHA